jgi:hypothetical protein
MNVDSLVNPPTPYTNVPLREAISVFRGGVPPNDRSADADRLPRLTVYSLAVPTKNPLWRAGLEFVPYVGLQRYDPQPLDALEVATIVG